MNKRIGRKNTVVFLLALFGMVCWGIAPVFAKVGLANVNPLMGLALRTMIASIMISSFIVFSGNLMELQNIPLRSWGLIAIEAILATLIGDLAYYAAIKRGDISLVTLIMSSSPIVTIICAVLFLGEQITLFRMLGAALIILGIILVI